MNQSDQHRAWIEDLRRRVSTLERENANLLGRLATVVARVIALEERGRRDDDGAGALLARLERQIEEPGEE